MNNLSKIVFLLLVLWAGEAAAAACNSKGTGNWNTAGTWSCGHVPAAGDSVTILNGHTITLNTNSNVLASLTVNAGGTFTTSGTSGSDLYLGGNLVNNGTINMQASTSTNTIYLVGANITSTFSGTGIWLLDNLDLNGAGGGSSCTGACKVELSGSPNLEFINATLFSGNSATYTFNALGNSTATVTLNRAGNQTAPAIGTTYPNLVLGGGGATVTMGTGNGQTIDVRGSLTINSGVTLSETSRNPNMTVAGSVTNNGTYTAGTGTHTFAGDFTNTGTFTNGAGALNVAGNFNQSGTFTAGTGTVTLNGGVQTISGTGPLGFANLTVNNAGITLARNVTVTSAIIGTVTLTSTCPIDYTLTSNGGATVAHSCPTTAVNSINLVSPNPSSPATAVSWTVTFSTSVTSVATGNFALVQSGGVSGASITSVTGSGTTWTVSANTGSGYGTLGLNMANVTGISPAVTTAMPFIGQVYTISAPMMCITDNFSTGTLDPTLWSVKTILGPYLPQVINAGGGDYRLRLTDTQNNEATFAQLKRTFPAAGNKVVLEIDYFSYGGSGADGIAVTFSDATIASTTGGFGGSLGYAQNNTNPGFGGGWMGVGLDEYGNYPCNNESRTGYPAGWTDPVLGAGATVCTGSGGGNHYVAIRGSGSGTGGYNLLANTGIITATAPASGAAGTSPYRYRFTLDHSDSVHAYVTVERDITGTGTSYTTLVPKFDVKASVVQAPVPTNWLVSFTGSTGGSTNNHEIKQVKVCANSIVGGGPDHLEIQHASGTGLTCTASTLTIKACTDAAVPCITPYTGGVTGTLSATGTPIVNWSGGSGFSIPSGSSTVTKDVQVTMPGSVVFTTTSSAAAATTCNFGTPACTFTAFDTGFLVSAPNHAAETSYTLTVQAVKKADNSLACVPAFAGASKTVNLKCAYSNPVTGTLPVRIGGTPLNATANAVAACDGTGANVALSFDASGIATPTLQYADVGQMNVSAAYTGIAGSLDAGLSMIGTGSFIAAPASFSFTGITAGTIKAGNPFSATVSALNNAGAVTPNFGRESTAEGVTLTSNLAIPDPVTYPAAANPTPGNNVIPGTEFGAGGMVNDANGVATVNNLSWGEAGSITLKASLTNTYGYLGTAVTPTKDALNNILAATGTSATVGPFIPDHFDTEVVATASAPMPCPTVLTCPTLFNGFVYSGQPFSEQVTARNLAGGTTRNYHSAYGLSHAVTLTAWDALGSVVTQNPGAGALANGTLASSVFNNGVGLMSTQAYTFASSPTTPTDIFLRAVDAVNATVTSLRATPATSVEGGVKVVSGKIKISNAHGSELLPLPMTATVQFYNAAGSWVTSTTDSVTSFDTSSDIVVTIVKSPLAGVSVKNAGVVTVAGGVRSFTLNRPLVAGSADISLNAPSYLPSTTGRATFGVYKGNNNFIYQRENY